MQLLAIIIGITFRSKSCLVVLFSVTSVTKTTLEFILEKNAKLRVIECQ